MITPPADGSLTLNGDGSFTYVPNAGYSGPDSFTYAANDGVVDSAVATVSITVISPPTVVSRPVPHPARSAARPPIFRCSAATAPANRPSPKPGCHNPAQRGRAADVQRGTTHAAQDSTVTFSEAGNYTFQVTITDPSNRTATSSVNVSVNQTLTAIAISPLFATLNAGTCAAVYGHGERPVWQRFDAAADIHLDDERGRRVDQFRQRPVRVAQHDGHRHGDGGQRGVQRL